MTKQQNISKREDFFLVMEGKKPEAMPFVPDITDWYSARRTPGDGPIQHMVGTYVPDEDPIHKEHGTMPEEFKNFTFLDFYRKFNWGLHSHVRDYIDTEYLNGIEYLDEELAGDKIVRIKTPKGELIRRFKLGAGRTWSIREHFVKNIDDLKIMARIVESQVFVPRYERVEKAINDIGDLGQVDVVIRRSPFGKLVHEYMGFEAVIYGLHDNPELIHSFLKLQEERDLEVIKLAADAPGRLIMISDHADENLIAPNLYEEYCIPFYRKAVKIFHKSGKFVSTHLDGNFKGFFDLLPKTTFDILDGCTPAPMFNYEVEELADAMPEGMKCFCGVPATLFCHNGSNEVLFKMADRIMKSLNGRAILNIGDVLPPDGNIKQVIALGEYIDKQNKNKNIK